MKDFIWIINFITHKMGNRTSNSDEIRQSRDVSNSDKTNICSKPDNNLINLSDGKAKIHSRQTSREDEKPWWRTDLSFLSPTLFGTWDGVFTSCMVNIFGVVIFLRTGWMVGNAGFISTIIIIIATESVSIVTVLSAIGICQKGQVECSTGGVYTLISHVMGSKVAAPVALLYCFGQAISCTLCVIAFGESILDILNLKSIWMERLIALVALLFILGVLALGITWLIGLQILLILLLLIAIFDFILGSFITYNPDHGVIGYNKNNFLNNTGSDYRNGEHFFSILGVFFPMSCGVLAGFQMGGDVKNPPSDIPKGTLAAIAISSTIYLMFSLVFSFTCTRDALRTDYMIAEKLSASHVLWLIGLYQLSLSSAVGNLCGCPTALMAIAADKVIAFLNPLAKGSGPNKVPFLATASLAGVSAVFLLFGQLNSLSVINTVLYLIAYAFVNYSHFDLCMSINQNVLTDPIKRLSYSDTNETDSPKNGQEYLQKKDYVKPSNTNLNYGTINEEDDFNDVTKFEMVFQMSFVQWTFSHISHPFISLIGAAVCLTSAFLISWMYSLVSLACVLIVWFIIGMFNPGVPSGATKFSYLKWARKSIQSLGRQKTAPENQFIVTKPIPRMEMQITKQPLPNFDSPTDVDPKGVKLFQQQHTTHD